MSEWTDDETDDIEPREQRVSLSDLRFASSILRVAAILSFVMWVVGAASSAWWQWTQFDVAASGGPTRPRLLPTIAASATSTWGYLLVAVVAYTGLVLIQDPVTSEANNLDDGHRTVSSVPNSSADA